MLPGRIGDAEVLARLLVGIADGTAAVTVVVAIPVCLIAVVPQGLAVYVAAYNLCVLINYGLSP